MPSTDRYPALRQAMDAVGASDPLRLLEKLATATDLTAPDLRHLRSQALHALVGDLRRAVEVCALQNEIVIGPHGAFVNVGGVLMECSDTTMYLKASREPYRNQAEHLARVLARFDIEVSTVVDVGANFGEIALWFARERPHARVLAIEPSSLNLRVLRTNVAAQSFDTSGVTIVEKAVSDRAGSVTLTAGEGAMNRIVHEAGGIATERVACDALEAILDAYGVEHADFVKIDIEGSEPRLARSIAALRGRVRSYYVEFSQFAPLADYLALARTLLDAGYGCYDEAGERALGDVDEIDRHLRPIFAAGPIAVTNLWFVARG